MSPTTTPPRVDAHRSTGLEAPEFSFNQAHHALIIGAGLAGCAVAKTLAEKGMHCTVFDASAGIAAAASSVPVAVFKPHVSLSQSTEQMFINSCFDRLLEALSDEHVVPQAKGLYQTMRSKSAIDQTAYWQRYLPRDINLPEQPDTLFSPDAGALTPADLCNQWIRHTNIHYQLNTKIHAIDKTNGVWSVKDSNQQTLGEGHLLVLSNAMGINYFLPNLPFIPVAGQINHFNGNASGPVICNRGYLVPVKNGVWSGATFHRGEPAEKFRIADTEKNLQRCQPYFPISDTRSINAWSGIRCTTSDHMPVVGAAPDLNHYQTAYSELHHGRQRQTFPAAKYESGLYLLAGLGSRGLVQALYSAECLADIIFGEQEIGENIKHAIHPARFLMRRLKRRSHIQI